MSTLTLDWLHLVLLLGAVQGVFLAGLLLRKRRNRTANRALAALMVAFSLSLVQTVYYATGYHRVFPHFFGVAYAMPFLFGPLIYLYAAFAADRTRRFTRRDALHLLPFAAVVIAGLPIYLMSGAEKIALYQQLQSGQTPPLLIRIADPLKFVSGIAYSIATVVLLQRHRERVKESYSSTERVNLRWLLWLGGAAAFVWLLATSFHVLDASGVMQFRRADDIVSLAVAILIYGIGYMGSSQPEIFRYETAEYAIPGRPSAELAAQRTPSQAMEAVRATPTTVDAVEDDAGGSARYERSGLSERQAQRLKDALLAQMEHERPWMNSELTLADLATRLRTTPHKLSEVLNSELGVTFYDFVNGYRVREVQRRIAAGEAQRVKMLTLALDAGFASKSTFNLVFKKHTNLTPSDYRQAAGA